MFVNNRWLLKIVTKLEKIMKNLFITALVISLFLIDGFSLFAQQTHPLTLNEIKNNLKNYARDPNKSCNTLEKMNICIINLIKARGINFNLPAQDEMDLKKLGATEALIKDVRKSILGKKLIKVDDYFNIYRETFNLLFLEKALKENDAALDELVRSSPESVGKVFFNKGRIYYEQEKYEEATSELLKAINSKYGGALTFELLARCYDSQENYDEAMRYFKEAIRLDDRFFEPYNNLGTIQLITKKEYDSAIVNLTKALSIKYDTDTLLLRGTAYFANENIDSRLCRF